MKLGFTGTEKDLPPEQRAVLASLLTRLRMQGFKELHHGDCIGGDETCHRLARNRGFDIEIHPPLKADKRAFCHLMPMNNSGRLSLHPEKYYLERDWDIAQCDALVACPQENHIEVQRSGVWATVRYARKAERKIYIIWPDGQLQEERG